MPNFKGVAVDIYNEVKHYYPATEETKNKIRYHYDFIFTKKGKWYYISSGADAQELKNKLHLAVEENDEQWKVVNALSGQIIEESKYKPNK